MLAQTALDAADHIIAVLDRMDGDTDQEDNGDAKPSLAAPKNHEGSQVDYTRGNDLDREVEAPETVLPEVAAEEQPETSVIQVSPLRWGGRGNIVAAVGVALLDLAKVR